MGWTVGFSPHVPLALIWAGLGIALVLFVLLLVRRSRGAFLRLLAMAALVAALANPILKQEHRDPLSNIVLVVLDKSASQRLAGREAVNEAVRKELDARLSRLKNVEIRWLQAGLGDETGKEGTALFRDINQALANIPSDRLSGIIVVTDGQIHDVPRPPAGLNAGVPLHAVLTGAKGEFDRRIAILKAPKYGIVGSEREIEVKVVQSGRKRGAGTRATLRIRREGKKDETRTVRLGEKVTLAFPFPHAGQNIVELELVPEKGELTEANNRVVLSAEGVRENLRVLLVSGEPHPGERTWRNLLKSDASVDLVHFTILRPPEKQDGTHLNELSLIAFPTRELFSEKLHDFDLIIFDRYQRRGVLPIHYLDNVSNYVFREGGAVLLAAGQHFADVTSLFRTPLSTIIPAAPTGRVIEAPFKPRVTTAGDRHPVTRHLPGSAKDPDWGRWFRTIEATANRGHVLMSGAENKPLLVLDRHGKGRVALLLSDHAWLWARGLEGGGPHTTLLRRLAHWLMKEPDLEEEFLGATAKGMKITIERRTMGERVDTVRVKTPEGKEREVTLDKTDEGVWRKTISVKVPGLYKFQSGKLSAVAHAGATNSREMREVVTTDKKLKPVLDESGGAAFWALSRPATGKAIGSVEVPRISLLKGARILAGSGWMGLNDRDAYITRGIKLTPLFTGFAALLALLGLLSLTWWREGR